MHRGLRAGLLCGGIGAGILSVILFGFSPLIGLGLILGSAAPYVFSE